MKISQLPQMLVERAVVLSSCAVERVFSQLKLIVESCGENLMEDMLEIRMLLRNNGDLKTLL